MPTKNSEARAANMREVFTFDDDVAFQLRRANGSLIDEFDTLEKAQKAAQKYLADEGVFIAFPRAAMDAENERRADEAARERAERIKRKQATRHAELVALQKLAVCGDAVHLMMHGQTRALIVSEARAELGDVLTPDVVDDIREQMAHEYEKALAEFLHACNENGRIVAGGHVVLNDDSKPN